MRFKSKSSLFLCAIASALVVQPAHAICTAGSANLSLLESNPTADWTDNGNQTVTHAKTGLTWKQCAEGLSGVGCATGVATSHTWSEAHNLSVIDTTGSKTDWRVPNFKELQSIVELCGSTPAINQTIFPNTPVGSYWAATPNFENGSPTAWAVDFGIGIVNATTLKTTNTFHVRLVRSGDAEAAFDTLAPELSDIKAQDVTKTSAAISMTSDIDATYYLVIVDRGSVAPMLEEVVAGVDYGLETVLEFRTGTLDGEEEHTITFDPLSAATEYDAYIVALNVLDNAFNFVELLEFNTYQDPTDSFEFLDKSDVALESEVVSDAVGITGLTVNTGISITDGEYSINSTADEDFTSEDGEISNGDFIRIRHTSSDTHSSTVETTITIGEISDVFRSTTVQDTVPDRFWFTDRNDVAYSKVIISDEIIVRHVAVPLAISIDAGEYSINGGAFTSNSGTVYLGDNVAVRLLSAPKGGVTREATLTIGSLSDTFSVTTEVDSDGDGLANSLDNDDDNDGVKDEDDLNPLDKNVGAATNDHGKGGGSFGLWSTFVLIGAMVARRRAYLKASI